MAQNSPAPGTNMFDPPPKFYTPTTPKNIDGTESVGSEAVKEKARYAVLFYRLFLASKYIDPQDKQEELVLGNLSEDFITALNITTRSESIRVFNNTFCTYRRNRLDSENYLGISINFPHISRAIISLLLLGEYRSCSLDEEPEYLIQTISILSFLPPP